MDDYNFGKLLMATYATWFNPFNVLNSNAQVGLDILDAIRDQERGERERSVAELIGAYALAYTPVTWVGGMVGHLINTREAARTGEIQLVELR
jgi:hypothetical protein